MENEFGIRLHVLRDFAQEYMHRESIHHSHIQTFQSLLVHLYFLTPEQNPLGDLLSPVATDMHFTELIEWVHSHMELPEELIVELELIAVLQGADLS